MKIKLISLIFVIFFITSCGEEELTSGSFEIFKKAKSLKIFAIKFNKGQYSGKTMCLKCNPQNDGMQAT